MKFTDYLDEANPAGYGDTDVNEQYSKSMGYNKVDDAIYMLERALQPKSNLAKGIMKEMGSGYKSDFDDMSNMLADVIGTWEAIKMDLEHS